MSPPPSRRSILAACGASVGAALAGCLGERRGADGTTPTTGTTTASSTATTAKSTSTTDRTGTGAGAVETRVTARNRYDEDVTLTVVLRRDGETVQRRTETVSAGVGTTLGVTVTTPGSYAVAARLADGATASYEWGVPESYRGRLEVRIREDGGLDFREYRQGDCGGAALPYAVPGNEETFTAASGSVWNESGDPATVTVSVAHDDTPFVECTHELAAKQTVSLGALTETAGEYAVAVDVAGGGRTTYDWRIPPDYNWPKLRVVVPESGDPLAGCGPAGSVDVTVSNPGDGQRSAALALLRDGTPVAERTVSVAGGEESTVGLETPIGDIYTLRAETDAGTATAEVADCYCYGQYRTTVALAGDGPSVESIRRVCD